MPGTVTVVASMMNARHGSDGNSVCPGSIPIKRPPGRVIVSCLTTGSACSSGARSGSGSSGSEGGVPRRRAGGILPEGVEKLYFVGLIAPRGPQIPIYGEQSKLVARMIDLHADAGPRGLALANYFAVMQDAELRIDIVRAIWNDQMADTDLPESPHAISSGRCDADDVRAGADACLTDSDGSPHGTPAER
mgnify:CR=1 FL=1